jgi:hypothetical protein
MVRCPYPAINIRYILTCTRNTEKNCTISNKTKEREISFFKYKNIEKIAVLGTVCVPRKRTSFCARNMSVKLVRKFAKF